MLIIEGIMIYLGIMLIGLGVALSLVRENKQLDEEIVYYATFEVHPDPIDPADVEIWQDGKRIDIEV